MTSWLHKQKKQDLLDLAKASGLKDADDLLKDDLVDSLNQHLRKNESTFASDPTFTTFYQRAGSPIKRNTAPAGPDGEKTVRKRKQSMKIKDEVDGLTETVQDKVKEPKAIIARTPKSAQQLAERVPLPASPADVANAIDRETERFRRRVSSAWDESGVDDYVDSVRDYLGSLEGIGLITLLIEALFLRRVTMPWVLGFEIPKTDYTPTYPVYYPNLAAVFDTSSFWAPSFLWLTTSLIAPGVVSYFVNLTKPRSSGVVTRRASRSAHTFDPVVFNLAKLVLSYITYAQGFLFWGLFSSDAAWKVNAAIPGEYAGLLITSSVGVLVSLYDAILRK